MQILNFKSKIAAITVIILMIASSMLMSEMLFVKAAAPTQPTPGALPSGVTASVTVISEAYLAVTPNPIGVNQMLLINVWNEPPINVARIFVNTHQITVTKPDGTSEIIGPLSSFAGDSTAWKDYTPTETGVYQFKYDFLGMYFPAGYYNQGNYSATNFSGATYIDSAYYTPVTSRVVNVTVQSDMVASWPDQPYPTDYWTRPVSPNNRNWWPILGNWPPTGVVGSSVWPADTNKYMSSYRFVPYTLAPDSAHILWKLQGNVGGMIGGTAQQYSYVNAGVVPTIIFAGRCYASISEPPEPAYINANGTYQYPTTVSAVTKWRCFDLRTGQIYWERPLAVNETAPSILTYEPGGAEVPGAEAQHTDNVYLVTITGPSGSIPGRIIKYNPWTGGVSANITGVPQNITAGTFYADPWVLSIQTIGTGTSAQYRLINWTIANNAGTETIGIGGSQPTIQDFSQRIWGNISWPFSSLGTVDFQTGIAVTTGTINAAGTGVGVGQFIQAASITTGKLLWNVTTDSSNGWGTFFSTIDGVADHGKFAIRMLNGDWKCWDLNNGNLLWTCPVSSWPWGSFGAYDVQSAYGYIFDNGYDGVHAINWTTGKIDWSFQAPSVPFETPYNGGNAWHATGMVADGKLYTFDCEHTPSQPITRGWKLYCLNATTGANIWNLTMSSGVTGSRTFPGAISDGYLTFASTYDGYMYVIGKGQSATTISAPQNQITTGQKAVITGTVTDLSPAQPGKPCVSQDSMGTYMEYLHMQAPIDGWFHNTTVTGVPVTIYAIDPNGNPQTLGTTISDGTTGAFGFTWTPQMAGDYKITATFAGSEGYGSSWAATYATVSDASATTAPTTSSALSVSDVTGPLATYITLGVIAIIIAIAVLGVMILRKK